MQISLLEVADGKNDHATWGVKIYHQVGFLAVEYRSGVPVAEVRLFRRPLTYLKVGGPRALLDCPPFRDVEE